MSRLKLFYGGNRLVVGDFDRLRELLDLSAKLHSRSHVASRLLLDIIATSAPVIYG